MKRLRFISIVLITVMLTSLSDIAAEDFITGTPKVIPAGTELRIALADDAPEDMKVVVQDIGKGDLYVLHLDDSDHMNGKSVDDLFSGIIFSG